MYEDFYGLSEKPFSCVPDTAFLFKSSQYSEAYNRLLYGISEKAGFMLITGDPGTGKTTLCRVLLQRLKGTADAALILNPPSTPVELLQTILQDLGADCSGTTKKQLLDTLNAHLLTCAAVDRKVVVFVDEAQNLSEGILEEIRMLSNFETEKEKLLQIILVGHTELLEKLLRPSLRQLYQRISIHYQLKPIDEGEVDSYIRYRLMKAGSNGDISFSKKAIEKIIRHSRCIPRRIHHICDRALLVGYVAQRRKITDRMVQEGLDDMCANRSAPAARRWRWGTCVPFLAAGTALLVFLAGGWAGFVKVRTDRESALHVPGQRSAAETTPDSGITTDREGVAEEGGSYREQSIGRDTLAGRDEKTGEKSPRLLAKAAYAPEGLSGSVQPVRAPEDSLAVHSLQDVTFDADGVMRSREDVQGSQQSLATLLKMWGIPEERLVREAVRWNTEDGTFGFYDNSRIFGFHVIRALRSIRQIMALNYPCIIPINENGYRYVVLTEADKDRVVVLDPRNGRRVLSRPEFHGMWSGRVFYVWRDIETLPPVLKFEDMNRDVITLKEKLGKLGFDFPEPLTEFYDEALVVAVMDFQSQFGLVVDGIFGGLTKMAFYRTFYDSMLPSLKSRPAEAVESVPAQPVTGGRLLQASFDQDGVMRSMERSTCAREALATLLRPWGSPGEAIIRETARWRIDSSFDECTAPFDLRVTPLVTDLAQMKILDYPCMVPIEEGQVHYAVLAGFDGARVILLDPVKGKRLLTSMDFGNMWTGEAFYVWKDVDLLPVGLKHGDVHKKIITIKNRFDKLGFAVKSPYTNVFDGNLDEAVRSFQFQFDLEADGILGSQTMLALYRVLYDSQLPSLQSDYMGTVARKAPELYDYLLMLSSVEREWKNGQRTTDNGRLTTDN